MTRARLLCDTPYSFNSFNKHSTTWLFHLKFCLYLLIQQYASTCKNKFFDFEREWFSLQSLLHFDPIGWDDIIAWRKNITERRDSSFAKASFNLRKTSDMYVLVEKINLSEMLFKYLAPANDKKKREIWDMWVEQMEQTQMKNVIISSANQKFSKIKISKIEK